MQASTLSPQEEKNKRISAVLSTIVFILMILALIYPFLTYPIPPLGQEGILVNLGAIDLGEGDENAEAAAAPVEEVATEEAAAEEVIPDPIPEPEPVEEAAPPIVEVDEPQPEPTPSPDPEILRQKEEAAIALRERKAAEAEAAREQQQKEKAAREAKEKADRIAAAEAAERKKRAEAAAAAKRAAEAKAAEEARLAALRKSTGSLFSGNQGSGGGRGNTGKPGNQGDPNGDPSADRLTGLSSGGAGRIGGGLESRGVLSSPKLSDNSQRKGRVVIKVCVDRTGAVTSAKYTQVGSTTTDEVLKRLAIQNAKNYRFSQSSSSTQCGHITYNFVVQ